MLFWELWNCLWKHIGEVKCRGQHSKTFHVKVFSCETLWIFTQMHFLKKIIMFIDWKIKQYKMYHFIAFSYTEIQEVFCWHTTAFPFLLIQWKCSKTKQINDSTLFHPDNLPHQNNLFSPPSLFSALSEWRPHALSCSVYANSKGRTGPSDPVAWVDVTRTWPWQQWKPGWAIVTHRLHPSSVWNILR